MLLRVQHFINAGGLRQTFDDGLIISALVKLVMTGCARCYVRRYQ